jgi:hypothetical protein
LLPALGEAPDLHCPAVVEGPMVTLGLNAAFHDSVAAHVQVHDAGQFRIVPIDP